MTGSVVNGFDIDREEYGFGIMTGCSLGSVVSVVSTRAGPLSGCDNRESFYEVIMHAHTAAKYVDGMAD